MRPERVVFIDFDGVLHPAGGKPGQVLPFEWVPELAALLLPYPDVGIVVHSSWAERFSLNDLREFLEPLGSRIIGVVGRGSKHHAIAEFLQAAPEMRSWIVIDDDAGQFPEEFRTHLIVCDPLKGLSDPSTQQRLHSWLEELQE